MLAQSVLSVVGNQAPARAWLVNGPAFVISPKNRPLTVEVVRDVKDWPTALRKGAVAIGNFDGVHRGHARIIDRLLEAVSVPRSGM